MQPICGMTKGTHLIRCNRLYIHRTTQGSQSAVQSNTRHSSSGPRSLSTQDFHLKKGRRGSRKVNAKWQCYTIRTSTVRNSWHGKELWMHFYNHNIIKVICCGTGRVLQCSLPECYRIRKSFFLYWWTLSKISPPIIVKVLFTAVYFNSVAYF
jgi:hypothetical protein